MRARRTLLVLVLFALPLQAATRGALVRGKLIFHQGSKNDWTELVAEGSWRAPMFPAWSERTRWVSDKALVYCGFEGTLSWKHHWKSTSPPPTFSKPPTKEELDAARRTRRSLDSAWTHRVTIDEDASDLCAMFDDGGKGASLGLLRLDPGNGHLVIEPPRISAANNEVDRAEMTITAINELGEKMQVPPGRESLFRGFFFDQGTYSPRGASAEGKWIAPKDPDANPDEEPIERFVQWNLTLREQQLEVLVFIDPLPDADGTSVSRWDEWLPKAGADERAAGSRLNVRAQVFGKDGAPTQRKAKFTFKLVNVSQQPGTCLNAPMTKKGAAPAPTFDLGFDEQANKHLAVFDDGQRAVSAEPGVAELAIVSAYDWGAFGTLEVSAVLEDGTSLPPGRLKEKGSLTAIPLPWREGASKIAAAWRKENGFQSEPDDWDGEVVPKLGGPAGDGLTLYEEYRGLRARGAHVRLAPEQKRRVRKLVVVNSAGAVGTAGIGLLAAATQGAGDAAPIRVIEVERDELRLEDDGSHGVNFNFDAQTPRGGLQHGVLAVSAPMRGSQVGLCVPIAGVTLPRSPRDVAEVRVSDAPLPPEQLTLGATDVAHELGHALGLLHHGDGEALYVPSQFRAGTNVRLFDSDGNELRLPYPESGELHSVTGGAPHGPQSGDVGCLMHYSKYFSFAVRKDSGTTDYYNVPEIPPGTKLCTSAAGTGYNKATAKRPGLFGDAAEGRGNCLGKVRIKDWP